MDAKNIKVKATNRLRTRKDRKASTGNTREEGIVRGTLTRHGYLQIRENKMKFLLWGKKGERKAPKNYARVEEEPMGK